ncbi:MAG: NifB/NifX family molybdenum-iron cluster-binding protein [Methanobacteriota archaeon]
MLMRIAIPASGQTVNDPMDTRFGRAPYIILFTPETGETVTLPNSFSGESGGVGPKVVQLLVQNQVTHLIAPRIGGNAETALVAAGIQVFLWEGPGSVSSGLELFKTGKLTLISEKTQSS